MKIGDAAWGTCGDTPVRLYTLDNGRGATAKISTYGGILTSLCLPEPDGSSTDVVLGFDTLEEYRAAAPYFGAMVGRVGNRIANGRFELDGAVYSLATNDGPNHLHGGLRGFDKVVWGASGFETANGPMLRLRYHSPDGEEGYPGAVDVTVDYVLGFGNELRIDMMATADAATPINLVHHSYWNLAGHGAGSILDHELVLDASRYTPTDVGLIPTGQLAPVRGTPYDFTVARRIGADLTPDTNDGSDDDTTHATNYTTNYTTNYDTNYTTNYDTNYTTNYDTNYTTNYDTNYVLDRAGHGRARDLFHAAQVRDPASGRVMALFTTMPGVQLYDGHYLDGLPGKAGAVYRKHAGLCLETQYFPDAINQRGTPGWPDPVLRPGETYHHRMLHRFGRIGG